MNKPNEIIEANIINAERKVNLPIFRMMVLGMMAGAFIAIGAVASSTAAFSISNEGLARVVSGCIFPIGLILITFIGGELFTGNCLASMGAMNKKFGWKKMMRALCIVWISNFIGAVVICVLTYYSGNMDISDGALGAYVIKVALHKSTLSFAEGVTSGILCNVLVCTAILLAGASKDVVGKICGIFFPIATFVIGGFEHCVANMYYIPAGMMAAGNPEYAAKASELYGITADQLSNLNTMNMFSNLLPVTIGNVIGGVLFVGLPCYYVYRNNLRIVK
ncbi:MAG: formate/nitrite transporter family protein [Lachnospiraceae bacterium]|nr:formate/nitrite transporter family protein [Lachnospiraceae bacterium]